ncbi:MAG: transporter [Planctomycetota bacterium]
MQLSKSRIVFVLTCLSFSQSILADHEPEKDETKEGGDASQSRDKWSGARPDGHAPIGVMGDHTHSTGEWMLSYRYMYMAMEGNRGLGGSKSLQSVLNDFPVAPIRMDMSMHMLGVMHAPSDRLTLMFMAPYIHQEMDHRTRMGTNFTTRTDGFGDFRLGGLISVAEWAKQRIHLNAGLSLPTGSIEETGRTPMGEVKLPYPMQLGSGTFDLLPGVTYLGQAGDDWSWGAQALGTVRLGKNSSNYSLGDRAQFTVWGARNWADWISTSLRIDSHFWGNIDGRDPDFNPAMVPTADPNRRGGERVDIGFGVNLYGRKNWYKGQRIALEFAIPMYQALDGPQLETDWTLTAGWQYAW